MAFLVIFESMFGDTREVAEAIVEGLGCPAVPVHDVDVGTAAAADLLVVGAPTHAHGMSRNATRKAAADDTRKHPDHHLDPDAAGPGVRDWLAEAPEGWGRWAAAFDTRFDKPAALTGSAAHGIAKRLRHLGYELLDEPHSFFVIDTAGPLTPGETDRARAWGRDLGERARTEVELSPGPS